MKTKSHEHIGFTFTSINLGKAFMKDLSEIGFPTDYDNSERFTMIAWYTSSISTGYTMCQNESAVSKNAYTILDLDTEYQVALDLMKTLYETDKKVFNNYKYEITVNDIMFYHESNNNLDFQIGKTFSENIYTFLNCFSKDITIEQLINDLERIHGNF